MEFSSNAGMMMENKRSVCSLEDSSIKRHKSNLSFNSKERKDKVGERLSALQQIVSPYGKVTSLITRNLILEANQGNIHFSNLLRVHATDRHCISSSRRDALHRVPSRTSEGAKRSISANNACCHAGGAGSVQHEKQRIMSCSNGVYSRSCSKQRG